MSDWAKARDILIVAFLSSHMICWMVDAWKRHKRRQKVSEVFENV